MKILFPHWKSFGVEDITEAFENLGHTVIQYENEPDHKMVLIHTRFSVNIHSIRLQTEK